MSEVGKNMNSPDRDDWDTHWDEYSSCAQNNPALEYRRRIIFSLLGLKGSGEGVRLLDVGSGQGDMAAAVRQRFPSTQILGLELSHSGVEISRQKVPDAQFVQRNLLDDGEPLKDQRGWATHAVCSEVIEHVDDPCKLLISARQYMETGCKLVITAPGGPMSAFDKHIGHRKHYRIGEIEKLFRAAGYEPDRLTRAGFPFFNLYRALVVLRGEKIVADAKARQDRPASMPARVAMALFRPLFFLNLDSSAWGWQMAATGSARSSGARAKGSGEPN
jgi:SAM-dependent methyltransferase